MVRTFPEPSTPSPLEARAPLGRRTAREAEQTTRADRQTKRWATLGGGCPNHGGTLKGRGCGHFPRYQKLPIKEWQGSQEYRDGQVGLAKRGFLFGRDEPAALKSTLSKAILYKISQPFSARIGLGPVKQIGSRYSLSMNWARGDEGYHPSPKRFGAHDSYDFPAAL